MKVFDAGRAFQLAWDVLGHLPGALVRGAFDVAGVVVWALRGSGVRRLEANYARVCPEASPREVRRLARAGMRAYMRYYAEVFTLRSITPEQLVARVRLVGEEHVFTPRAEGRSVVAALTHMGNWDLAGAYSGSHIMPVVTVAERLEPPRLYEEFLEFRESLGMTIHTLGDDGVFTRLLRATKAGGSLVPLLADRDLTARGLEVDMFGRRARVAAGPAALAVATGAPLLPISMWHERLTGERRRRAGTPWGLVIRFHPAVEVAPDLPRRDQTLAMTQGWVDAVSEAIAERPEQWHMLQRVFVEDLDPERYARTTAAAAAIDGTPADTQEER